MGVWVMQRGSKWEKEQQHKSERGGKERYGADYDGGGGMRECGGEKLEESKKVRWRGTNVGGRNGGNNWE